MCSHQTARAGERGTERVKKHSRKPSWKELSSEKHSRKPSCKEPSSEMESTSSADQASPGAPFSEEQCQYIVSRPGQSGRALLGGAVPIHRQQTRPVRARPSRRSSANGCNGWWTNRLALLPLDQLCSRRPPQLIAATIAAVSYSGGFRNSERGGSSTGARSASANFWVATPTSGQAGSPN